MITLQLQSENLKMYHFYNYAKKPGIREQSKTRWNTLQFQPVENVFQCGVIIFQRIDNVFQRRIGNILQCNAL